MKITDTITLEKLVRKKRREQKLTQKELAGASGIGIRFIIELEKGKPSCHIGKILIVLEMLGIALTTSSMM